MTEDKKTILRAFEVWMIQRDERYGFFLTDQGHRIIPLELWEEMKVSIDNLYAISTLEDRQDYNDALSGSMHTRSSSRAEPRRTPGKVYLLHGEDTKWFKIGITLSLKSRVRQLGANAPFPVTLIASYDAADAIGDERKWHTKFSPKRTRGEWFELSDDDVLEFVARSKQ